MQIRNQIVSRLVPVAATLMVCGSCPTGSAAQAEGTETRDAQNWRDEKRPGNGNVTNDRKLPGEPSSAARIAPTVLQANLYVPDKRRQLTADQVRVLIGMGDHKALLKLARERINENPKIAVWHELDGLIHVHQQQGIEDVVRPASDELKIAEGLAPRDSQVLATSALVHFLKKDTKELESAVEKSNASLKIDPNNKRASAIHLLSSILLKKSKAGKHEVLGACRDAEKEYDVYVAATRYFRMKLEPDGVDAVLKTWVENMPESAYAYFRRGQFREAQRDYIRAGEDFAKASELNGNYVTAIARLAFCQYKNKRYNEALKTYERIVKLNGMTSPARYLHRAQCYSALGKYDRAIADYKFALEKELGSSDASKQLLEARKREPRAQRVLRSWWDMRAEAYEKTGAFDKAIEDANLAVIVSQGDAAALDFRRQLYERLKKYDLALKDLNAMISMNPTGALWYKSRADVLLRLGRKAEAEKDLKRFDSLEKTGVIK